MQSFWRILVRPLLEAMDARVVVEIGAETGRHTRRLLGWCERRGAVLHVIDPDPAFEPEALAGGHPDRLVFHRRPSLEVIEEIPADAVLIDGDHNWYTVHHELLALERAHGERFPLVLLHDVAWPYARRDMYYAPERIPPAFRKEYGVGGLCPGRSKLQAEDGLSPELCKALEEGGPGNGVLTAVEDFLEATSLRLRFERVPVDFGLGILAGEHLLAERPALTQRLDALGSAGFQARLAVHAETRRLEDHALLQGERTRLQRHVEHLASELGRHEAELRRNEREVLRLRGMLSDLDAEASALRGARAELERLRAELPHPEVRRAELERLRGLEAELAARRAEAEALRAELVRMQGSRSWRLTAPLRLGRARVRALLAREGAPT